MSTSHSLVLGAVAYDPKVVTIWDGFQQWFRARDLDFDYVLYTNYERQVEQHFAGAFDVAWNSPLAWLQAQRVAERKRRTAQAIVMRDTDQDLTSVIVVRDDAAVATVDDLRGRTIGVGAADSPQATMIPLETLAQHGLVAERDFAARRFDVLVGKHGDHIGGERHAARALANGEVDAVCLLDQNHLAFQQDGTLPRGRSRVLLRTGAFDHCNFTALDGANAVAVERFRELLLGMRYDDPTVRPLLDLEGLKAWRPGRTTGYALLAAGVERFGWLEPFLRRMGVA